MNKIKSILIIALLSLILVGCGSKTYKENNKITKLEYVVKDAELIQQIDYDLGQMWYMYSVGTDKDNATAAFEEYKLYLSSTLTVEYDYTYKDEDYYAIKYKGANLGVTCLTLNDSGYYQISIGINN